MIFRRGLAIYRPQAGDRLYHAMYRAMLMAIVPSLACPALPCPGETRSRRWLVYRVCLISKKISRILSCSSRGRGLPSRERAARRALTRCGHHQTKRLFRQACPSIDPSDAQGRQSGQMWLRCLSRMLAADQPSLFDEEGSVCCLQQQTTTDSRQTDRQTKRRIARRRQALCKKSDDLAPSCL